MAKAGQGVTTAPREPSGPKGGLKPRLNFALTHDGQKIAVDALQPKVREKLVQVLSDPELPGKLGLARPPVDPGAATATPGADTFGPELVGALYDALGPLCVAIAQRAGGYTEAQARLFLFNQDEKKALVPITDRLLDKYFPGGFGKYQDEIMLCVTLGTIVTKKMAAANALPGTSAKIQDFPRAAPPMQESQAETAAD